MAAPKKITFKGKKKVVAKAAPKPKKELSNLENLHLLADKLTYDLGGHGRVICGAKSLEMKRLPIGILAFDVITGGGLVQGRYHELYGPESSGKTTVAMIAVAAVQRAGGTALWLAREEFDKAWARAQGVDVDNLVLIEAEKGDVALETGLTLLESGHVDILVFDSIQAFTTTREAKDSVEHESMGGAGTGQLWGRVMRKALSAMNGGKCAHAYIIGISQVRSAIGKYSPRGVPEDEPTQIRAIKHWKSISISCRKGMAYFAHKSNKLKRLMYARDFILHCKKNKTAIAERHAEYRYFFREVNTPEGKVGRGPDEVEAMFRFARVLDLVVQKGSFYEGFGLRKQGAAAYRAELRQSPELQQHVRDAVIDASLDDSAMLTVDPEEMKERDDDG